MAGHGTRPEDTQHSWQFTVFQDGVVEQHYPVTAWCWHSGDRNDPGDSDPTNNQRSWGIEEEGGPPGDLSEPWTSAQFRSTRDLLVWGMQQGHIANLDRAGLTRGLLEHNEIVPTRCPSNRNPWVPLTEAVRAILWQDGEEEDVDTRLLVKTEGSRAVLMTDFVTSWQVPSMDVVRQLTYMGIDGPRNIPRELFDALWATRTHACT
jgi:N-acetyl-anhydromuramyl-L-alanine amidase AmpD